MKTKLFSTLFAIYFIAGSLKAAVFTVANVPTTTIAQFSTIQAAINASSSGDTILVNGSPNDYAGFTLTNKRLVIIGPGRAPDVAIPFPARINSTVSIAGSGSNNTQIQGFIFLTTVTMSSNHTDSMRFIRNQFNSIMNMDQPGTYLNYIFEGNIFINERLHASTGNVYQNFVIQNNIFYNVNDRNIVGFKNPLNSVIIDHNLFFGPSSSSAVAFENCGNLVITNNIFVRRNAAASNVNSTFSNNITFNAGNNTPWDISNGNLDGGGNIANQDPQMAAQAGVNSGLQNFLADFTVAAGPANNSGTDGKDMGLLYDPSGSLNWTNSRNSRLPRIYNFVINNPTIPAGGTLNIQVEGRKSN